MILDLLIVKKYQGQIRLWWGMRNQEDCFWTEDFDELEKDSPNFKWDLVLSNPPADWPLHFGHVTQHVLDYVQAQRSTLNAQRTTCFYLCGNKAMIDEVSTKLKETGITGEHIHTENFFDNMGYSTKVLRDKCIGAASCVAVAAKTFKLDDKNIAVVINSTGDKDEDDAILLAAQSCPTAAIEVYDQSGKKIWPV